MLLTWLLLLTGTDEKGVADIATVPARERPICNDLGIYHRLDVYIEEKHDLEILELIVPDLA